MKRNTTPKTDAISALHLIGNITPKNWYKTILTSGSDKGKIERKPHFLAIAILSDIVYWYRNTEVRDEFSGHVLEYRKKFSGDLLQRGYSSIMEDYPGVTKQDCNKAVVHLESLGLIKRVFKTVYVNEDYGNIGNVMFIDISAEKVEEATFSDKPLRVQKVEKDDYYKGKKEAEKEAQNRVKNASNLPQNEAKNTSKISTKYSEITDDSQPKNYRFNHIGKGGLSNSIIGGINLNKPSFSMCSDIYIDYYKDYYRDLNTYTSAGKNFNFSNSANFEAKKLSAEMPSFEQKNEAQKINKKVAQNETLKSEISTFENKETQLFENKNLAANSNAQIIAQNENLAKTEIQEEVDFGEEIKICEEISTYWTNRVNQSQSAIENYKMTLRQRFPSAEMVQIQDTLNFVIQEAIKYSIADWQNIELLDSAAAVKCHIEANQKRFIRHLNGKIVKFTQTQERVHIPIVDKKTAKNETNFVKNVKSDNSAPGTDERAIRGSKTYCSIFDPTSTDYIANTTLREHIYGEMIAGMGQKTHKRNTI